MNACLPLACQWATCQMTIFVKCLQTERKLSAYKYFTTVRTKLTAQLQKSREQHAETWQSANDENGERVREAFAARCWELDLWPSLVSVADAVVHGVVTNAPRLYASVPSPPSAAACPTRKSEDYFTSAVDGWVGSGLKAVPLCELAAVLVSA